MSRTQVGPQSVRGTGTSGHVQASLVRSNPRQQQRQNALLDDAADSETAPEVRTKDSEILAHEQARKIEARLFDLGCELRDKGLSEQEIESTLEVERQKLQESQRYFSKRHNYQPESHSTQPELDY